ELKATKEILPVHRAQIMSYMKLSSINNGLIINFHVKLLKDGIERFIDQAQLS
ncbi:MAG: GxxExxY protein, partial [Prevotella sp.]|nr:GxxExxY protein [Prevotella sp.]